MLADPRVRGADGELRRTVAAAAERRRVAPGADCSTNFDETLRQALRRETELFFDSLVREDRRVIDLLTADYTFLNERLAQHYGIPACRAATSGA